MRKINFFIHAFSAICLMVASCSSPPPKRAARCAAFHDRLQKCVIQDGAIPSTIRLRPRDPFVQACLAHWIEMKPMLACVDRDGCEGFVACFRKNP